MSDPGPESRGPTVPAVDRAARTLDAVADSPRGLTLSEVARALDAPKSSLLAVCSSLVAAGLLVRRGRRYELGPKLLQLGSTYLDRLDLATEFRRADAELGPLPDETMVLSRLECTQTRYLATRPGRRAVAIHYQPGMRLPAHCTASGKSQLALLTPQEVAARYAATELERLTPHSIGTMSDLACELEKVRERGYAVDDEETALGMICVGAAVTDVLGSPTAAVSVSMVKAAVDDDQVREAAAAVRRMAHELAVATGGSTASASGAPATGH